MKQYGFWLTFIQRRSYEMSGGSLLCTRDFRGMQHMHHNRLTLGKSFPEVLQRHWVLSPLPHWNMSKSHFIYIIISYVSTYIRIPLCLFFKWFQYIIYMSQDLNHIHGPNMYTFWTMSSQFGIDFLNIPKPGSHWHLLGPQPCPDLFYWSNSPFNMLNIQLLLILQPWNICSQPTSGGPWRLGKYPQLVDIGWPMSNVVNQVSADPSIMELMAEHYVKLLGLCKVDRSRVLH